jgi:hypothetical protein
MSLVIAAALDLRYAGASVEHAAMSRLLRVVGEARNAPGMSTALAHWVITSIR